MQLFSQPQGMAGRAVPELAPMLRTPQRISATLPWQLMQRLHSRAALEGRSLSNLVAFLLEQSA
jgi:hypothetical protein